jgi:hypothetical protein
LLTPNRGAKLKRQHWEEALTMGQKIMKTDEELRTIVMGELRTHQECRDVAGVTIRRLHGKTWGVRTIARGSNAYQRTMEEVVAQFNTAYGLAKDRGGATH